MVATTTPREGAVLDRRTLNRSLLRRQFLLRRAEVTAAEAIEHLVGLQAQVPQDPYTGLWSRVAGFAPGELSGLLARREAVRIGLMRWTIHLVTTRDCLALRPVMQQAIEQRLRGNFRQALAGLDLDDVARAARPLLDEEPMTTSRLGERLRERWPDRDRLALGVAAAARLPLVQPPPRGLWRTPGAARHVPAASWLADHPEAARLGDRPAPAAADDATDAADAADAAAEKAAAAQGAAVHRYLTAFGPASAADIAVWSGLTGVRTIIGRLRGRLVSYRDERGTELYDVPGAPFPDPDVPAPPRFLPQYDNALLSHDDRARVFRTDEDRARVLYSGRERRGTYLVDGFLHGTWRFDERRDRATLTVEPYEPFRRARGHDEAGEVEEEAARLLRFLAEAPAGEPARTGAPTVLGTVGAPEPMVLAVMRTGR
ncbi:winged helix DNA-binding domain-containing protein [Streptomyces sp.]|uniref:winged helix DNA-binding domain-containing protein n=1 Tax=Streptomyces sp. TaxID=1931 RepID=UPI002F427AEE